MAKKPPISIGFNVPFHEAIAAAKQRGVVLPDIYYGELQGIARQLAFSIAGVASLDQLQAVKDSLHAAMDKGVSFKDWKKTITVQSLDLPDHRLDNIWRTNLQGNYMRGKWEQFQRNAEKRPFLMYDAINDSRVRPSHLSMDGTIRRMDDPFWKSHSPPNGYRSILPWQRVSGHTVIALKAFYSGPAVEIVTRNGARMALTAQHPVLTDNGWVQSDSIRKGDNLACYRLPVGNCSPSANLNKDDAPPTIEEIFNAFGSDIRTTVPRAAVDLYGDVEFIEGDVEVVCADRALMDRIKSECSQFRQQFKLSSTYQTKIGTSRFRPRFRVTSPANVSGSNRSTRRPLLESVTTKLLNTLFNARHQQAVVSQVPANALFVDMHLDGNIIGRHSRAVHLNDAFWNWLSYFRSRLSSSGDSAQFSGFLHGPFDTSITDVFIGGFDVNPDALRCLRQRHPGLIEVDEVVDVRLFDYSGHVYDLETKSGHILPYGGEYNTHLIVSNCRCSLVSLTEAQAQQRSNGNNGINKVPVDKNGLPAMPDKGWHHNPFEDRLQWVNEALAKLDPELQAVGKKMVEQAAELVKKPVFVPAATVKEAEKWMMDNDVVDLCNFGKIKDVDLVNEWNRAMFEHIQEFPELRKNQRFTGSSQAQVRTWYKDQIAKTAEWFRQNYGGISETESIEKAKKIVKRMKVGNFWAWSWNQKIVQGISINEKWATQPDKLQQSLLSSLFSGFHPINCETIKSIVDHELGHQLDALLDLSSDKGIIDIRKATQDIKQELSEYAKTNIAEFIAEAWAEYRNNPNPRPVAKQVGDLIRERYAARYAAG